MPNIMLARKIKRKSKRPKKSIMYFCINHNYRKSMGTRFELRQKQENNSKSKDRNRTIKILLHLS